MPGFDPVESSQLIVNKYVTIDSRARALIAAHLAETLRWTEDIALVSRRDPVAAVERLLAESIEMERLAGDSPRSHILDIGSGAGFPGMAWACLHPESRFLLVERREKKAAFLERTARLLRLNNVDVFVGDVRDAALQPEWAAAFDFGVTMAVGDPTAIARELRALLKPGAHFLTTFPRDLASPPQPGPLFHVKTTVDGEFGRYALYTLGV